jgi:NADPH:quinone reductase-like Zn-dependent oxidoreductase
MKAVGVIRFGGPEALRQVELPEPHAGPGQIRIRVFAATVNPGDRYVRNGSLGPTAAAPPYLPGMEAAGVVDEIGASTTTELRPGDRVMTVVMPTSPNGRAYAEHLVAPVQQVVRAPAGSTHAQAATLPMNGLTADLALERLALRRRVTLAVTGGAGAVGGYTIQLAKARGLRIVANAAPADESLVRALGADLVIPRGLAPTASLRETVPEGVDGLVDAAMSLGTHGVSPADAGIASAVINTSQQVGGSVGTALLNTIAANSTAGYLLSHVGGATVAKAGLVHGFSTAYWWAVGFLALSALVSVLLVDAPGRVGPQPP